jgi:hypothetical protein
MICPVCDESSFARLLAVRGQAVLRCQGCGCVALDALSTADCTATERYANSETEPDVFSRYASRYMDTLRRRGFRSGSLLVVAGAGARAGTEAFLDRAKADGFRAEFLDLSTASANSAKMAPAAYDAAIMLHRLQMQPAPGELLRRTRAALRPGAPLLLTVPRLNLPLDSSFGRRAEWRIGNRWYFDETTIQSLLLRYGFHEILVRNLPASGMLVTAVRDEPPARPKCSIVVAAFNESRTFPVLMDALLKKAIPGVDREIVVIESNSTDGTRELAKQYQGHPEIKLVLQDRPRGKGHAIREGFRHATGDVVLIQDADLEYDLDDYDALLAPILSHRALFVLGTRHGGDWKIRRFAKQRVLSTGLNLGHAFFTGLINVLFRQNMTDPFTMFKVFRRDCLFGLELQCNRFDFDHELLIKLVRKGYRPLEVPVNYRSRSFREGKKVRLFRDPFTWIWVDLKLRFTRVLPKDLW